MGFTDECNGKAHSMDKDTGKTNAIVTVIGRDAVGIIARVSTIMQEHNVNILDINQTIMQSFFTMIMMVDLSGLNDDFSVLSKQLEAAGIDLGLQIRIQHEDIFNSMHRI
jgi:ACT domain-containing protein